MMDRTIATNNFVGYEYKDITVSRDKESIYVDGYKNFGWTLDGKSGFPIGLSSITMKFKRDRKIRNKAELTRLQRQFDTCVNEIASMENSKASTASIVAFTVGVIGTAFLAGATFSYLAENIVLCIIMAIPGFVGWILPYFLYNLTFAKKAAKVAPLIESKYDEIYEVCERANDLLGIKNQEKETQYEEGSEI
jgi:hypothetical protein